MRTRTLYLDMQCTFGKENIKIIFWKVLQKNVILSNMNYTPK